jgi:hypothetical protein
MLLHFILSLIFLQFSSCKNCCQHIGATTDSHISQTIIIHEIIQDMVLIFLNIELGAECQLGHICNNVCRRKPEPLEETYAVGESPISIT